MRDVMSVGLVLKALVVAVGVGGLVLAAALMRSNREEEAAEPPRAEPVAVPPMDTAAPVEVETATFALG